MSEEQKREEQGNEVLDERRRLDTETHDEDQDSDIIDQVRQIEIRSEEVQEIMGYIPRWIIRWGITLIFIILFLILVGSYFFSYPDVIISNITVTTEHPPAPLVARISGKIDKLLVKDNQKVVKDQCIVIFEDASDYNHVFQLKDQLHRLRRYFTHFDTLPVADFNKDYVLGELQNTYAQFLKSYDDYRHFIQLDYHRKKIEAVNEQISQQMLLYSQSERQVHIMEDESKISKQKLDQSTKLYKDGIISKSDYDSARSSFLQQQYSMESAKSALANSGLRISQLKQSILDLQLQYRDEKKTLELTLSQIYENLTGTIAQWEQTYLLKSPIDGIVTFTNYWSEHQNVTAGERVVTIIPEEGGKIIGKVVLPIAGSGKVKVGQHVNIKFQNYPYVEYGMVRGVVTSKSLIASDNYYSLEVDLPNGLMSSYNIELEFNQEMQGTAEIITEDLRLLERILKPIKNILDKM